MSFVEHEKALKTSCLSARIICLLNVCRFDDLIGGILIVREFPMSSSSKA